MPLPHRKHYTATLRHIPHSRWYLLQHDFRVSWLRSISSPQAELPSRSRFTSPKLTHLLEYAHSARIPRNPLIQTHPSVTGVIRFPAIGFRFFSLSVMSTFQFSFAVLFRYRSRIMYLDLDGMHHPLDTSIPRCATRKVTLCDDQKTHHTRLALSLAQYSNWLR